MDIQVTKSDGTTVSLRVETIARHLTKEIKEDGDLNRVQIPEQELFNIIYDGIEELIYKNES
tara:strand:+ start:1204 stop:1389 length:186 start_codon:yes stop_codon:yes gene_type:complete